MDFGGDEDKGKRESLEKSEENNWEETESSSDEDDDLDWEHEDIIEQLKQEIRNARTGGLTTILEEDEEELESPQMVQGLKPLKIEEKVEYKDIMNEIHKVYKTYVEKMRKLDVLNYQTMHAIGFLQLKDPVKLISMQNPKVPGAKPLLSQNLWPLKAQKNIDDPMLKFVGELNRDLELVYVGQVCLSWEILHWQQGKAQELKEYDLQGCHQYNQVADEFQLFQVLLQRFIENEPFQGPRVRNYVKNRCVIRNLLQVPAIRDDYTKDKNIKREYGNEISSKMLTEIINESMRVFREFVCADKDEDGLMIKVSRQRVVDCKDSGSSKLVIDVRTNLQKKEKKLKDILRTRNCLVKKFQKHRVRQLEHDQFLAQVELKLISKVLSLSKLTEDQLIWCHEKLDRITIADRKVHVEPSFLLFPC
ncbi:Ribosomal protein L34Ae [Quillaja saponaria]|uniref:Ribosomal protein L34Ae n=1 Tax=Quillaja saponaria TaxID=32244 RepID=A0AAD7KPA8_QUISA|nr:Ribosomal protein L34Ae [Quillaja saponaria]